jgi:hypothetical protein
VTVFAHRARLNQQLSSVTRFLCPLLVTTTYFSAISTTTHSVNSCQTQVCRRWALVDRLSLSALPGSFAHPFDASILNSLHPRRHLSKTSLGCTRAWS